MKQFIIGVLVVIVIVIVLGFQKVDKKEYEYYDFKDNYGTSSECRSTLDSLICKTKKGCIEVKQYSEVVE